MGEMARDGIAVRVAPGTGLLVRRPTSLLYAAVPDQDLVAAFAGAPAGGELQALASATVAAGFAVGAFVALAWPADVPRAADGVVRVMAFGDVAVETDQPSLPMLSGAGSRTWVEHTLAITDGAVVEVRGADTDAATDLVAGTVLAGGFRLELARRVRSAVVAGRPAPVAAVDDTTSVRRTDARPSDRAAGASLGVGVMPPPEPGPSYRRPSATPPTSRTPTSRCPHRRRRRCSPTSAATPPEARSSTPSCAPTAMPTRRRLPRARCAAGSSPPARRRSSTSPARASGASDSTTAS